MSNVSLLDGHRILVESSSSIIQFEVEIIVDGFVIYACSARVLEGESGHVGMALRQAVEWLQAHYKRVELDERPTPVVNMTAIEKALREMRRG